jgi:thymidylate synthase
VYIYIYIYTYTHKYICAYNNNCEKRDHRYEGDLGGAYGKVWRKEREEGNVVIKIKSQILKLNLKIKKNIAGCGSTHL